MMSKKLLSNADGFETHVELLECLSPKGYKTLRFTTLFERSRHPDGERQAYQVTLSPESLDVLKGVLNG